MNRCLAALVPPILLVLSAGCVAPIAPAPALSADSGATAYDARSLHDDGLNRFLRENLGRDASTPLDFDTLCWVGFYYHPALELARAQWATARAGQRTAAQRPNPTLTLAPGYNFTRDPGLSPWMPSIGADLLVPTGGKRAKQQAMAEADAEAARVNIATAAWQLRSDLRKALLEASTAGRHAAILQRQVRAQEAVVQLLEQRLAAGSIAATEVSVARTALLRLQASSADAATQQVTARARVAAALGLPVRALDGITLPTPQLLPPLTPEQVASARAQALRSRADVLGALAKYRAAQAALELELARRYPDIHLGPDYQYDQGQNKWTLGLTFELPVFNHNEGPIAEAEARRAEAVAQFNVVQNQVVGAIDAATAAAQVAGAQLENARRLSDEVRRQTAMTEQRRAAGAADQLEVATAGVDAMTAELSLADAEDAVRSAAGQLEDALQMPLPHWEALTKPAAGVSANGETR